MRCSVILAFSLLLTLFGTAAPGALHAQRASARFSTLRAEHAREGDSPQAPPPRPLALLPSGEGSTRSHTKTGLLIGSLVGAAATTVFLIGFCNDPDTACGADEVGRAVLFIAVPCAAAGALIGSLVKTED